MELFKVTNNRFELNVPLMKYDERTGEFEGWATVEELDKSGEIIDVEKSWPLFEAWSQKFAKATDGESYGNVREQHDPKKAAGKLTSIVRKDMDGKDAIYVTGKAVDKGTREKLVERVLVGLSIGGEYVEKSSADDVKKGATRYVANPSEISLVDNPCVDNALITVVKADGTQSIAKAVGFNPQQGFQCRAGQFHVKKDDARKCDGDHSAVVEKAAEKIDPAAEMKKSLYGLSRLACILADLMSARSDAEYEAAWDLIAGETPNADVLDALTASAQAIFDAIEAVIADERASLGEDAAGNATNSLAEAVTDYSPVFEMSALIGALKKSATAKQLIKSLRVHTGNGSNENLTKEDTMSETKKEEQKAPVEKKTEEPKVEKTTDAGELSKAATDQIAKAVSDGLSKALEPISSKVESIEKAQTATNELVDRIAKTVKAIVDKAAPPTAAKRVTKAEDGKDEAADHGKQKSTVAKTSLDLMGESLGNPQLVQFGRLVRAE